jgi:hypothetical protein
MNSRNAATRKIPSGLASVSLSMVLTRLAVNVLVADL